MIPSQHVCLHNKFRVNGRVHILSITAFNRVMCSKTAEVVNSKSPG